MVRMQTKIRLLGLWLVATLRLWKGYQIICLHIFHIYIFCVAVLDLLYYN